MKKNKAVGRNYFLPLFLFCVCLVQMQGMYRIDKDIPYISGSETDVYRLEHYKLDVYCPKNKKDFSTIVQFHGSDMEGGDKFVPRGPMDQSFAVVVVNYRSSPRAKDPAYIEDAAEAVAWTFWNIEKYGGRKDRVFVPGHSARGYLMLILATDKRYMATYGANADSVTTYLPVSGQTVTYFTIRKERSLSNEIPVIDESAPVNRAREDTAPVALTMGDKNLEMVDRYEEDALLASALKNIGNRKVSLYELQGLDYGQVLGPACYLIVNYTKRFK